MDNEPMNAHLLTTLREARAFVHATGEVYLGMYSSVAVALLKDLDECIARIEAQEAAQ